MIYCARMSPQAMRIAFLVLFAVLTVIFAVVTWPFAKAAFLAFTIALIFFPMHRMAMEKLKLPRYLSAILTTLVVSICVIFPLAVLGAVVVTRIGHFLQDITSQAEIGTLVESVGPILSSISNWIERMVGSAPSVEDLEGAFLGVFKEAGRKFYEFSPRVLSTTASLVGNFLLTLLFLAVFLAEGGNLYGWLMETTPLSPGHRKVLARDVRLAITSSIIAALVTAVVQGTLLGAGFWLAGFNQPYSWGLVATILCLIPVIGAASCYITATVLLVSAGRIEAGIIFLVFGIGIVSFADNVVKAIVVRGTSRMHPLLLFVTLIGAVRLLGPIGLLVGPVLLAIFLASIRIYRSEFMEIGETQQGV